MTRSFVAADHPVCPKCGSPTCSMTHDPDRQFQSVKCSGSIERRATLPGYVDPMSEPAVQGWLNSGLVPPS
jgi:hypothetical protein